MKWEPNAVSHVLPNVLQVTGRDATLSACPGAIVYVPGGGWSSVQEAVYSGGNTWVFLSDAVCFAGMTAVAYATPAINPANLCTGGTPLSSGDNWSKAFAFDGNTLGSNGVSRIWLSSHTGLNLNGVAWIGYRFSSARKIRWFRILQSNGAITYGNSGGVAIASVLFEYSDNGSSWTPHSTHDLLPELFQLCIAPVPAAAHEYWRIRANANAAFDAFWGVNELQMGE